MSNLLLHVADRVLNEPLLVTPDKAEVILSVLSDRMGVEQATRFEGSPIVIDDEGRARMRPYNVTTGGVGIITVTGTLVSRGAYVGASSGLTSYEGVQHQLKSALTDPKVRAVILDLHSPGGEVIGSFETAAMVRELATAKPIVAVVNGLAASAAYAIASGATEIVSTRAGISGSIGVVYLHADMSRKLANEGVAPTLIHAGARKIDGNPFAPLSDEARSIIQARVDALYEMFLETVELGRGNRMGKEAARATEARAMLGPDALAAGLVDRIGTFESVLADLQQKTTPRAPASGRTTMKGKSMDTTTGTPAADAGISQEEHQAAVTTAEQKGATAATTRLTTILAADGVKGDAGRMTAAIDLAVKAPSMSAADVTAFVTSNVAAAAPAAPAASTVTAVLGKLDKAADGVTSTVSSGGAGGQQKPAATTPDGWKAEWEASTELKAEYPTAEAYVATKKRDALKVAA